MDKTKYADKKLKLENNYKKNLEKKQQITNEKFRLENENARFERLLKAIDRH